MKSVVVTVGQIYPFVHSGALQHGRYYIYQVSGKCPSILLKQVTRLRNLSNVNRLRRAFLRSCERLFPRIHSWYKSRTSKPRNKQKPIAQRYNDQKGDDTSRYASRNEMFNLQIPLAGLRILHHDSRCMVRQSPIPVRRERKDGHLLILGKPLVGRPMAAEHIRALPMTSKFGCGSVIPAPTVCTKGRMINAATV